MPSGAAPLRQAASGAARSIVDLRGATVRLAQPARRIVTLAPALTEAVCMLDACDRLVATDRWSNWPATAAALPKVGGLDDVRLEAIVMAQPDLVLVPRSVRSAERLQDLGLTVAVLEPERLADVERMLADVGHLLGRDAVAARVWRELQATIDAEAAAVPAAARGARVYLEVDAGGYAAGPRSFIGEMLARLGARNVVPDELGAFPALGSEFVLRADPDLLIVPAPAQADLARRPGWSRLRAVRAGRVCALDDATRDVVVRPGPRLAAAAAALRRCLAGA